MIVSLRLIWPVPLLLLSPLLSLPLLSLPLFELSGAPAAEAEEGVDERAEDVLRVFGSEFSGGGAALLLLAAGQLINIATGSVGFVLIMVGRTGWDLVVYAASLALNLGLAFWLCPRYGMEGAAVANAVTFALSKWARLALVKRFVGIQPYDRDYSRLIIPTVGSVAWLLLGRPEGAGLRPGDVIVEFNGKPITISKKPR